MKVDFFNLFVCLEPFLWGPNFAPLAMVLLELQITVLRF